MAERDEVVEKRVEYALAQLVRAEIDAADRAADIHARLERWRGRSADNETAWQEARRRWALLSEMAPALREGFGDVGAHAGGVRARRQVLLAMGSVSLVGLLSAGLLYRQKADFIAQYATGIGQLREFVLPDASAGHASTSVTLNAASAIEIELTARARRVRLGHGEARFDVARDEDRPFVVETRFGRVTVLGTRFSVADRGGVLTVAVETGRVRFSQRSGGLRFWRRMPELELTAGDVVSLRDGSLEAVRRADVAALHAWSDGWLVFENARLDDVAHAINAYRPTAVRIADPGTAALRFTGRFRAADTDALLGALPELFPLAAVMHADGSVELHPR